jgi:hypothetical protein
MSSNYNFTRRKVFVNNMKRMQYFPQYMRTLHIKSDSNKMIQHIKRMHAEVEELSNMHIHLMMRDYFYVLYAILITYPGHDIKTEHFRMIPNMHKIRKSILYSIRKIRYWRSTDKMHQKNINQEKAYLRTLWKMRNTIIQNTLHYDFKSNRRSN